VIAHAICCWSGVQAQSNVDWVVGSVKSPSAGDVALGVTAGRALHATSEASDSDARTA